MSNMKYITLSTILIANFANADWIVSSDSNCKVHNPFPQPNETATWNGDCKEGYANGKGTVIWYENGKEASRYTGDVVQGKPHGKGNVVYTTPHYTYEGDFKDGKAQGKGTLTYTGKFRYTGDFKDNKMTGKGVLIVENGTQHEGEFLNNKKHGWGIMKFNDGSSYEGQWQNNQMHGIGKYKYPESSNSIKQPYGYWQNGYFIVSVVFKNGERIKYLTKEEYENALQKLNAENKTKKE